MRDLQQNLNQLGLKLHIHFGDALSVLDALHSQYAFEAIWAHQETGNAISYRRDMAVHQWARDRRVAFHEPVQNGVVRRLAHRDHIPAMGSLHVSPCFATSKNILAAKAPVEFAQIPDASALGIRSMINGNVSLGEASRLRGTVWRAYWG